MTFTDVMLWARRRGHSPGIYARGDQWRVHLDTGSNDWADVASFTEAKTWLYRRLRASSTTTTSEEEP